MKQVIKRVLKGLLPNRFLNAYRHVENLGAFKEQIRSNVETLGSFKEQIRSNVETLGSFKEQIRSNVETLGSFKEQINSIANQVNSILWRAERVMSINELFVETPKEKVEGFIKSLHPIKTEHELVRWGAKHDGGYLIPNDFKGIRALFSPGVGGESAFEEDFYRQCKLANNDIYIYIWQTSQSMNRY